jgi:hypothetical protein
LHLSDRLGRYMQKGCLCWRSARSKDRKVVQNSVTSHPFPEFSPPPQHPTSQQPNHEWHDSWQDKRVGRGGGGYERHCTSLGTSTVTTDSCYNLENSIHMRKVTPPLASCQQFPVHLAYLVPHCGPQIDCSVSRYSIRLPVQCWGRWRDGRHTDL